MIERIQIRNFQRHSKLRIVFDPRVTTIVGPSDVGKSSILRAIRWVVFNKPRGDGFIRHGEDACTVKLWVDGHKVERRRGKGKNVYVLDGQVLAAVGSEVPQKIRDLFKVGEENLQGQHDPLFWFSLTPGELAKRLNAIVDLEVIDKASAYLASKLRKTRAEEEVIAERLSEATKEAERLSFIEDCSKEYNALVLLRKEYVALQRKRDSVSSLVGKIRTGTEETTSLCVAAKEGAGVLRRIRAVQRGYAALCELDGLVAGVRRLQRQSSVKAPPIGALQKQLDKYNQLVLKRDALVVSVTGIHKEQEKVNDLKRELARTERQFHKETGGRCPVCGNEM